MIDSKKQLIIFQVKHFQGLLPLLLPGWKYSLFFMCFKENAFSFLLSFSKMTLSWILQDWQKGDFWSSAMLVVLCLLFIWQLSFFFLMGIILFNVNHTFFFESYIFFVCQVILLTEQVKYMASSRVKY